MGRLVVKKSIGQCPICHRNFYKKGDFQRHLTMIEIGTPTENRERHKKLTERAKSLKRKEDLLIQ